MKVSVIVPVYQVEKYIGECLRSVLTQTLSDIEVICVDDGGQDASMETVRKAAGYDKRIRILENRGNQGLAASRNRGLSAAWGDYVYFLDSDDLIRPDALERLTERAEREDLDVQIFGSAFLFETPELHARFRSARGTFKRTYPEPLDGRSLYIRWMEVWDWMCSQPRYFYRRSFLLRHGIRFMEGILHEDEAFAYDVLMHAERVRVTDEPLFIRRFREGSIMTGRVTLENVRGCVETLVHIRTHIRSTAGCRKEDPAFAEAVCTYMKKLTADARNKLKTAEKDGDIWTPEVSVIIPVYNAGPYLAECLDSVLTQTLRDFEVICCDDGSDDGSGEVLRQYEETDPRVRLISHTVNSGPSWGRNEGIRAAKGRYLYMLDADDLILPETLKELSELLKKTGADVAGFENRQFTDAAAYQEAALKPLFSYAGAGGVYSGPEAFARCVREDILSPSVPTFFLRTSYVKSAGLRFMEGILHEDIGFILEMLCKADRVVLTEKAYFLRRFRPRSIVTSAFTARNAEGYLKSFLRSFELEKELTGAVEDGFREQFLFALGKWRRDVLGRIRVLYLGSEETLYSEAGGHAGEEVRRLFEVLKLTTTGRARAADILGNAFLKQAEACGEMYICGDGQYAERALDLLGALDVCVPGIIVPKKTRRAVRGIRVFLPEEVPDPSIPVLLAVSHYRSEEYEAELRRSGFTDILHASF